MPVSVEDANRLTLKVESAWLELPNAKTTCAGSEKIPIQAGGIGNYFCYLNSFSSYRQISQLLGIPIFVSGPHTEVYLVTNDLNTFGFYHPEFPIRMRKYFLPAVKNLTFRSLTQKSYDLLIQKTARTFFSVHRKLSSNSNFFEKETDRYYSLVTEKRLEPYYLERFTLFLHPDYTDGEEIEDSAKFKVFKEDESFDPTLVKQVVGFWLRRRIDGTENDFLIGLSDLIQIYDNAFFLERLN